MAAAKVILLSVLAAVLYGIAHDQVTARICIEYFTIGHPRVLATESPTALALVWGVLATWWVGLLLGVPLAWAARWGRPPRLGARSLLRPVGFLVGCMAGAALLAGLVGYALAAGGSVVLVEPLSSRVPADRHTAFLAVGWAHGASYLVGFVGGIVLILRVRRLRRLRRRAAPD